MSRIEPASFICAPVREISGHHLRDVPLSRPLEGAIPLHRARLSQVRFRPHCPTGGPLSHPGGSLSSRGSRGPDAEGAMRPVTMEEIENLAIGGWILGTGGCGSPYLALEATLMRIRVMIEEGVDRMKTEAGEALLIAVGGGSFLVIQIFQDLPRDEAIARARGPPEEQAA